MMIKMMSSVIWIHIWTIQIHTTAACLLNASGSLSGRVAKRGDGLYAFTFHSALTYAT